MSYTCPVCGNLSGIECSLDLASDQTLVCLQCAAPLKIETDDGYSGSVYRQYFWLVEREDDTDKNPR